MSTRVYLHIYESAASSIQAIKDFAEKKGLTYSLPHMSITDEENNKKYYFRYIKTKDDAFKFAGINISHLIFHNGYEEEIPDDAYFYLLSRVRLVREYV